jgi:uncharacterized cupin superfamily protein
MAEFILIDCIKIDVNLSARDGRAQASNIGGESMTHRAAFFASEAPPRAKASNYPEPFAARMAGRLKRPLGDIFGLRNFGVNLTRLAPGAASALHHSHSRQDELIYVLEGEATLFTDEGETQLHPGMVAGFAANGTAHHLENNGDRDCVILEIGDRTQGDEVSYPADDIEAALGTGGKWQFAHKDGRPYREA